ncbi:hypothetical protein NC796_03655 [Aliifodinibius sp. S!AR15-10]|uniref:hypothetical protein n=1 Tax=Aliifodinibius sp. S!AR15-10 TaxID=2950437 RepID=UPI00285FFDA9|nr:hypothetical protein [Aliifodinibius sp. S!AR15-10]MDR8390223.1 hypothetical protein [Aliifodinibius sp. S!AR15-10]
MADIILRYCLAFLLPAIGAVVLTPWIIKLAYTVGAVDQPKQRKVHTEAKPRLGGVVIFFSIGLTFFLLNLIFPEWFTGIFQYPGRTVAVVISLIMLLGLGIWDDITPLSVGIKFGVQFVIASIIYFAGFQISTIMNPLGMPFNVELIDYPLTILWIIGITNAFNLIDGLDGLAAGVGAIASFAIFIVAAMAELTWIALFALMLAGSTIGFLKYNFKPARIFLGDSGSLLIGFALALLSILSSAKTTTQFSILFPILVLGLPISDTLISMLRRFLGGYIGGSSKPGITQKLTSMFKADKAHIHHQILSRGITHRNTVILLYIVSALFAFSALLISRVNSLEESFILLVIYVIIFIWSIKKLRYREIDVFRNGIFLPLYERFILNKVVFLSLLDLLFITASYSLPFYLLDMIGPQAITASEFSNLLLAACIIQLSVFWLSGLYKENLHQMGWGDVLYISRNVFYAVLATTIALPLMTASNDLLSIPFMILNFYLLLTLVLGLRISYHALRYLFKRHEYGKREVLIYGANEHGALLLQHLLAEYQQMYKPVGFLDDNTKLEGTFINGYEVLGGYQKLPSICQQYQVDTIFFPDVNLPMEEINSIKKLASKHQILLKKTNVKIEDLVIDLNTTDKQMVISQVIDSTI